MSAKGSGSEHATAVLIGPRAVLIRGPAGAGKSSLALRLIEAANAGRILFARLVADDRVALSAINGRLIASAPAQIAGMIEVRGLGVRRLAHESYAVVGLIVDLAAADAERLPAQAAFHTSLLGVTLPRLPVPPGEDPLPNLLRALEQAPNSP